MGLGVNDDPFTYSISPVEIFDRNIKFMGIYHFHTAVTGVQLVVAIVSVKFHLIGDFDGTWFL